MANSGPHAVIELIVRGALFHDQKILVCRNRKHGHIFLPGGHIEHGEPARIALEREIQEELGLTLRATRFLGTCESSFTERRKHATEFVHEVNLVFLLEASSSPLPSPETFVSQEEKIEFAWIPLQDLATSRRLLPPSIIDVLRSAQHNPASDSVCFTTDMASPPDDP